ncbi:MBL fold metallo-hydrolase [Bacteroidales bacterium OttesenSCG-928-I14]|nr:MBL fold metallo-hydrolase [Bacteroidales bacterium OttesenSCG-928-I14]
MIQYKILETGFFWADGGAMFGPIPKRAWNRKAKSDEDNRVRMGMNCLLAWDEQHVVLLDTGVGTKSLGQLSYYDFHNLQDIRQLVRNEGFEVEDITHVVLSHLHFDHCGACTYIDENGKEAITFPKAQHYVSQLQWDTFLSPSDLEKDSFRKEDLFALKAHNLLHYIEKPTELFPGFKIDICDGHTHGQLVSSFISGSDTIVFPGDLIPTKNHVSDLWLSAYDIEPLKSLESKRRIKDEFKDKSSVWVYYHDSLSL